MQSFRNGYSMTHTEVDGHHGTFRRLEGWHLNILAVKEGNSSLALVSRWSTSSRVDGAKPGSWTQMIHSLVGPTPGPAVFGLVAQMPHAMVVWSKHYESFRNLLADKAVEMGVRSWGDYLVL